MAGMRLQLKLGWGRKAGMKLQWGWNCAGVRWQGWSEVRLEWGWNGVGRLEVGMVLE